MPGYRHNPLEDIQRIRQDLRDRYKDGFPILKELLQNADDASAQDPAGWARRFVLVICPQGVPGAGHSLLRTPGLGVLNDGQFTRSDAHSITSLGMSNKAGQYAAVGKFGLGLKSIFHWAETYFYFASPDFAPESHDSAPPQSGSEPPDGVRLWDLLNPWSDRSGKHGLHGDWDEEWGRTYEDDRYAFTRLADRLLEGKRWFGLWIPLRPRKRAEDTGERVKPMIVEEYPGIEPDQLLGVDWRLRLAETLPLLRRVQRVEVRRLSADGDSAGEILAAWEVASSAIRLQANLQEWPQADNSGWLEGHILGARGLPEVCFAGRERLAAHDELKRLKEDEHWPSQSAIDPRGEPLQIREKALPHGAVVFVRQETSGPAELRLQHAVYLPLGEPEQCKLDGRLRPRYSLYLHGYFFVDPGRRDILMPDNQGAGPMPERATSELEVTRRWNQVLLQDVVAPLVLPSLDKFVRQEQLPPAEVEALVKALRDAKTLGPIRACLCRGQRYVYRLHPDASAWVLESASNSDASPPRWLELPAPDFPEADLFALLPDLAALCREATVSLKAKPSLAADKPASPSEEELARLVAGVSGEAFQNLPHVRYLLKLLPDDLTSGSPIVCSLVPLANQLLSRRAPEDEKLRQAWSECFKRLPKEFVVKLPCRSDKVIPEIAAALGELDLPVALLWQDLWSGSGEGKGKIPLDRLGPVLEALGHLSLDDPSGIEQRSIIAVRLLQAVDPKPDDGAVWAGLPLFAARSPDPEDKVTALSREQLREAARDQRLFTAGDNWARDLEQATQGWDLWLVKPEVVKALGLEEKSCDARACVHLLQRTTGLAPEFGDRQPLFQRLLQHAESMGDPDPWPALRYLVHGQRASWDKPGALYREPAKTSVLVKLVQQALESAGQSWRLIPQQISRELALTADQQQNLGLCDISPTTALELIKEIGPTRVDCAAFTDEECGELLRLLEDPEVLRGLNLHETWDGRRVRIGKHTYVDDGAFKDLPKDFDQVVTRINGRPGYEFFQGKDGSNQLANKLSWEAVIEVALSRPQSEQWAEVILQAIGKLGSLRAQLREQVRQVAWLPLANGAVARPQDLLHIPGAERELDQLPAKMLRDRIPILRLPQAIRDHDGFATFTKTILSPAPEVLKTLADLLRVDPTWSTGLDEKWSKEQVKEQVADWVNALSDAPAQVLPVAALVRALYGPLETHKSPDDSAQQGAPQRREPAEPETRKHLPEFLGQIAGHLTAPAYAEVLKHLATKHQKCDMDQQRVVERVFLRYLGALAKAGVQVTRDVLSKEGVVLLSQNRDWKSPAQLAWPTHGLQPGDQLDLQQYRALGVTEVQRDAPTPATPQTVDEEYEAALAQTAQRLRDYFQGWDDYVPREVIGAFICVLGDGPGMRELAESFLGQRTVEGVRAEIAEAATSSQYDLKRDLARHRFACVLLEEYTCQWPSVVGMPFQACLCHAQDTLFLGSGVEAFPQSNHFTARWLKLLPVALKNTDQQSLLHMLRVSTEEILHSVYRQPNLSLEGLWKKLGQPAQLGLRIAQDRVVNAAWVFLQQIGAHRTPAVQEIFKKWNAADRQRTEAEVNGRNVPDSVEEQLKKAKADLRRLLESETKVQRDLLRAVRDKMRRDYGYDADSVPFEIWQNADDALVQFQDPLGYDATDSSAWGFVILCKSNAVGFAHWGRQINEFVSAHGRLLRDQGFDSDLEKMVLQAISDKQEASSPGQAVTGKFGLGFKSVFLVSDAPEIVSGSVDFTIRGGCYPMRLDPKRREALEADLKRLAPDRWRRGTLILLPWGADLGVYYDQVLKRVLERFQRLAPLLVVFARRLKRLRLYATGQDNPLEFHWQPRPLAEVKDVECGEVSGPGLDSVQRALVLTCELDNDRGQILLGLGDRGFVALPEHVPVFWVTAPTRQESGYGFAVNAPFNLDVGRAQLAWQAEHNQGLAEELAKALHLRLCALRQRAVKDWPGLREELRLASGTTAEDFWQSLWELLGRRFAGKCPKEGGTLDAAALALRILWTSATGGLQALYHDCPVLPTGLYGEYAGLTALPALWGLPPARWTARRSSRSPVGGRNSPNA